MVNDGPFKKYILRKVMIDQVCLIVPIIYNPPRMSNKPKQFTTENNEGTIMMVQEAVRLAMQAEKF